MESIYYIGLDVHKKTIAYCIKTVRGEIGVTAGHRDLQTTGWKNPEPTQSDGRRTETGEALCDLKHFSDSWWYPEADQKMRGKYALVVPLDVFLMGN